MIKTTMSFSLSRDEGKFEWASDDFWALFCQGSNVFKPRVYRMMWDILRFNLFAVDLLSEKGESEILSIGEYLDREGYSQAFKEDYLLPLSAGIWSIPPEKVALDFPAMALIRFFHNHQMLQLYGKPAWLTIKGGSKTYVDYIISKMDSSKLHLNVGIDTVQPTSQGIWVTTEHGKKELFDKVILAAHTDQAVRFLGQNISEEEKMLLGDCQWSANEAVVHYDEALMPMRKKAWTAWNYLTSTAYIHPTHEAKTSASDVNSISITFNLNILQSLPISKRGLALVTLNPPVQPDPSKTLARYVYHHPELTPSLINAQKKLDSIQGRRGVYFSGAWTGYGFHEDGWRSGMEITQRSEFDMQTKEEILYVDGRDVKFGMVEKTLRVMVGMIDWSVKGLFGWMIWMICVWISIVRRLSGRNTSNNPTHNGRKKLD
ncbi:amine oxidase [Kwoniella mangroviensis CBS 8886]|nr:amine oxidase [Kwoniella mangroviensis CBS 8886]